MKSVIVLQNQSNTVHALSLQHSGLQPKNQTYLEKFLDVTKSQLFFANAIVLVEGISVRGAEEVARQVKTEIQEKEPKKKMDILYNKELDAMADSYKEKKSLDFKNTLRY